MKRKITKKKITDIALILSILLTIAVVVYGIGHKNKEPEEPQQSSHYVEEDVYYLDEHELAEFSETIIEQFHKESKLIVSSIDTSVSADLKQTGILDINILNKTQKVVYKGTGRFYVDLSMLGKHSVSLDNNKCAVIIEIPHTQLMEIEIDPDRFTFEAAQKGLLAFGDLRFTAREYNDLETECKRRIREAVDRDENYRMADERAVEEMIKIYDPIVKAVDAGYHAEIVFMENS